jgi:hypothetical protein
MLRALVLFNGSIYFYYGSYYWLTVKDEHVDDQWPHVRYLPDMTSYVKSTWHNIIEDVFRYWCITKKKKDPTKILLSDILGHLSLILRWTLDSSLVFGESEWLLVNANSAIFKLYHGENKLIFFYEMMCFGLLCAGISLNWNKIIMFHTFDFCT